MNTRTSYFVMQTAIAYSATDGGVIQMKNAFNEAWEIRSEKVRYWYLGENS